MLSHTERVELEAERSEASVLGDEVCVEAQNTTLSSIPLYPPLHRLLFILHYKL